MSEQNTIPEGTYRVKLSVDAKTLAGKKPVYIAVPVFSKPVIQSYKPFNITEQSESSEDHTASITVDEFKAAYDYVNPKEVEGKERSEYQTILEKFIADGVISVKYVDENDEEISQSSSSSEPAGETPSVSPVVNGENVDDNI